MLQRSLFFVLALALAPGAPAEDFLLPPDKTVWVVQDRITEFDLEQWFPGLESVTVFEKPRNGHAWLEAGVRLAYQGRRDFFGRDSIILEISARGQSSLLVVELRIFPRFAPVAGRWFGQEHDGPGFFDAQARRFVLCAAEAQNRDLRCTSWPIQGAETGVIPAVIAGRQKGREVPALFDPNSGDLFILKRRGAVLKARLWRSMPNHAGRFPVFGDWDGNGSRSLVFVDEKGLIFSLKSSTSESWPQLAGAQGDSLLWPIRWSRSDRDALAVIEPATSSFFQWVDRFGAGGADSRLRSGDLRRPVAWSDDSAALEGRALFLFEDRDPADPSLQLREFLAGHPVTVPIKFPNDPPPGG